MCNNKDEFVHMNTSISKRINHANASVMNIAVEGGGELLQNNINKLSLIIYLNYP